MQSFRNIIIISTYYCKYAWYFSRTSVRQAYNLMYIESKWYQVSKPTLQPNLKTVYTKYTYSDTV